MPSPPQVQGQSWGPATPPHLLAPLLALTNALGWGGFSNPSIRMCLPPTGICTSLRAAVARKTQKSTECPRLWLHLPSPGTQKTPSDPHTLQTSVYTSVTGEAAFPTRVPNEGAPTASRVPETPKGHCRCGSYTVAHFLDLTLSLLCSSDCLSPSFHGLQPPEAFSWAGP